MRTCSARLTSAVLGVSHLSFYYLFTSSCSRLVSTTSAVRYAECSACPFDEFLIILLCWNQHDSCKKIWWSEVLLVGSCRYISRMGRCFASRYFFGCHFLVTFRSWTIVNMAFIYVILIYYTSIIRYNNHDIFYVVQSTDCKMVVIK